MKIALVHDYLQVYGGAERVLEALHEVWPEAPVYTAFAVNVKCQKPVPSELVPSEIEGVEGSNVKCNLMDRFRDWDIRTTWLQKIPWINKLHSPLRFLAPFFWESLDFSQYDAVISSSSPYFGKGIITKPQTLHISYCHTPPRFLYGYATAVDWQKRWLTRWYGRLVNHYLRQYDYLAAQRVDYFIANSLETKRRIAKFYRRNSTVIYPPVLSAKQREISPAFADASAGRREMTRNRSRQGSLDIRADSAGNGGEKPRHYYLVVSRLARAKGVELAIKAANELKMELAVVGIGREEKNLKEMAGPTVKFAGEVDDEQLWQYYRGCQALIFPALEEDFGMVPVEAMSFGKPVIAYKSGGVLETVIEGKTGLFFKQPTVPSLVKIIQHFETIKYRSKFNSQKIANYAKKFGKERFKKVMREFVEEKYAIISNF